MRGKIQSEDILWGCLLNCRGQHANRGKTHKSFIPILWLRKSLQAFTSVKETWTAINYTISLRECTQKLGHKKSAAFLLSYQRGLCEIVLCTRSCYFFIPFTSWETRVKNCGWMGCNVPEEILLICWGPRANQGKTTHLYLHALLWYPIALAWPNRDAGG